MIFLQREYVISFEWWNTLLRIYAKLVLRRFFVNRDKLMRWTVNSYVLKFIFKNLTTVFLALVHFYSTNKSISENYTKKYSIWKYISNEIAMLLVNFKRFWQIWTSSRGRCLCNGMQLLISYKVIRI